MILKLVAIAAIVAIILIFQKSLLRERKRKIDQRAKALGMEPVFEPDQMKQNEE